MDLSDKILNHVASFLVSQAAPAIIFQDLKLLQKQLHLDQHLPSVLEKLKAKQPKLNFHTFDWTYYPNLSKNVLECAIKLFGATLKRLNVSGMSNCDDKVMEMILKTCTSLEDLQADSCHLLTDKPFKSVPSTLQRLSLNFGQYQGKKLVGHLKKVSTLKLLEVQNVEEFTKEHADEVSDKLFLC